MPGTAEIKERIKSIEQTKKVTDAMYMVSSVKMRRAKAAYESTEPYFSALKEQIGELFRYIPKTDNRYIATPEPPTGEHRVHGLLLITSDRSLAGGYNQALIKLAEEYKGRHPNCRVFIVGRFAKHFYEEHGIDHEKDFFYPASFPSLYVARRICADMLTRYDDGDLDEIDIIYTDRVGGRQSCLLPLERSRFSSGSAAVDEFREFLPTPDSVLDGVIPSYLTGFIYGALAESYCSEQEARMSAMKAAGDNAKEMLGDLRVEYNMVRQAAITREMTEITAGSRAKKRSKTIKNVEKQG